MKRIIWSSLVLVLVLALIGPALMGGTVEAQNGEVCYAVADNDKSDAQSTDQLVTLNKASGVLDVIGATGTFHVEAIAFDTDGVTLYAAEHNEDEGEGQLGTLDLANGAFTATSSTFGTGSGVDGDVTFSDIDSLAIYPATGELYGAHRREGGLDDVLIKIDKSTGAHVPDAFGTGVDYVVISGTDVLDDIDDIAIDPSDGTMYATANEGGDYGDLITINMSSGAATLVGPFNADDMEGLAFFTDGNLYGSSGEYDNITDETKNKLYSINKQTGAATELWPFTLHSDYEALGCLTEPSSVGLLGVQAADGSRSVPNTGLLLGLAALIGLTAVVVWRRETPPVEA